MNYRHLIIAAIIAFATAGSAVACTKPAGASGLQSELVGWINAQRKAKGLSALTTSGKLTAAAQGHACDMAGRGYFSHQRSGGPDLPRRLKQNGYGFRTVVENIAKTGAPDVGRVGTIWRKSGEHWKNLMNPKVRDIGIGVATGGGQVYWVMNAGVTH